MDLASLQVFQMVAREKSFSRAAEKLYRTQPAVSISVRKLEEWVGQPLFVRGSGARVLTDTGVLLLEYADRMLNLREEIRKAVHELGQLERGQVQVGANERRSRAALPGRPRAGPGSPATCGASCSRSPSCRFPGRRSSCTQLPRMRRRSSAKT